VLDVLPRIVTHSAMIPITLGEPILRMAHSGMCVCRRPIASGARQFCPHRGARPQLRQLSDLTDCTMAAHRLRNNRGSYVGTPFGLGSRVCVDNFDRSHHSESCPVYMRNRGGQQIFSLWNRDTEATRKLVPYFQYRGTIGIFLLVKE